MFCNSVEKLESPSFHLFRWLKGSACDLRGTQAAYSKKKSVQLDPPEEVRLGRHPLVRIRFELHLCLLCQGGLPLVELPQGIFSSPSQGAQATFPQRRTFHSSNNFIDLLFSFPITCSWSCSAQAPYWPLQKEHFGKECRAEHSSLITLQWTCFDHWGAACHRTEQSFKIGTCRNRHMETVQLSNPRRGHSPLVSIYNSCAFKCRRFFEGDGAASSLLYLENSSIERIKVEPNPPVKVIWWKKSVNMLPIEQAVEAK